MAKKPSRSSFVVIEANPLCPAAARFSDFRHSMQKDVCCNLCRLNFKSASGNQQTAVDHRPTHRPRLAHVAYPQLRSSERQPLSANRQPPASELRAQCAVRAPNVVEESSSTGEGGGEWRAQSDPIFRWVLVASPHICHTREACSERRAARARRNLLPSRLWGLPCIRERRLWLV